MFVIHKHSERLHFYPMLLCLQRHYILCCLMALTSTAKTGTLHKRSAGTSRTHLVPAGPWGTTCTRCSSSVGPLSAHRYGHHLKERSSKKCIHHEKCKHHLAKIQVTCRFTPIQCMFVEQKHCTAWIVQKCNKYQNKNFPAGLPLFRPSLKLQLNHSGSNSIKKGAGRVH